MDERSERHVTHPWTLARQRSQRLNSPTGAEAPSSSARLALEAAFVESQAPAFDSHSPASSVRLAEPRTGAAVPAVVIKRRRSFTAPGAASASPKGFTHSDAGAEGDRAPRVFRPAPITTSMHELTVAASAATARPLDNTELSGDGSRVRIPAVPTIAARRPRQRATPAVLATGVTKRQEAAVAQAATAVGPQADDLRNQLAALDATLSLIRDARDFRLVKRNEALKGCPDPGSYFALTVEIRSLQGVAEAARKAEASQAISWIRRAIEAYGLTRNDLGI